MYNKKNKTIGLLPMSLSIIFNLEVPIPSSDRLIELGFSEGNCEKILPSKGTRSIWSKKFFSVSGAPQGECCLFTQTLIKGIQTGDF